MIDIWGREIRRFAKLRPKPAPASVFVARKLTKGERYTVRSQAFELLDAHQNREQVIDTLLMQHEFLSWRQADLLVRQAERALKG